MNFYPQRSKPKSGLVWDVDGHKLYGVRYYDEDYEMDVFSYECVKPDGQRVTVDVIASTKLTLPLFKKWIELGCPDRTDLRMKRPISSSDIDVLHYEKFVEKK